MRCAAHAKTRPGGKLGAQGGLRTMAPRPMVRSAALVLAAAAVATAQDRAWETIQPGGDTGCGYGGTFQFHFRPGSSSTSGLVIDFQGGGACWDALTCALPIWLPSAGGPPGSSGLASVTNEANPVRDYNCASALSRSAASPCASPRTFSGSCPVCCELIR
jgi:hypothetical protein